MIQIRFMRYSKFIDIIWALLLAVAIAMILSSDMFNELSGRGLVAAYISLAIMVISLGWLIWKITRGLKSQ